MKDDEQTLNKRRTTSFIDAKKSNMGNLYKNTYFNTNRNKNDLMQIKNDMDDTIDKIISSNINDTGQPNISNLYAKTLASTDDGIIKELKSALQDETMLTDIMDMYSQNAVVRDLDKEIDVVCKYMPKLEEALEIKIDHILSADHFNKDAIELTIATSNDKETTSNPGLRYNQSKD